MVLQTLCKEVLLSERAFFAFSGKLLYKLLMPCNRCWRPFTRKKTGVTKKYFRHNNYV